VPTAFLERRTVWEEIKKSFVTEEVFFSLLPKEVYLKEGWEDSFFPPKRESMVGLKIYRIGGV